MTTPTSQQLDALVRLWNMAQGSHSGARVALRIILGCYNGTRFPFDLTDLRLLDAGVLQDVLTVLVMDSSPYREVHELLNTQLGRRDIGPRLEVLANAWRLKGAVKSKELAEVLERIAYLNATQGMPA